MQEAWDQTQSCQAQALCHGVCPPRSQAGQRSKQVARVGRVEKVPESKRRREKCGERCESTFSPKRTGLSVALQRR